MVQDTLGAGIHIPGAQSPVLEMWHTERHINSHLLGLLGLDSFLETGFGNHTQTH